MNKLFNNEKTLIILRGVSGSGKTTFAEYLVSMLNKSYECEIFSADNYFYKNGKYEFDASKLSEAHSQCKQNTKGAMKDAVSLVIVANTNTSEWEYKPYVDMANEYGYSVVSLVVENLHGGKNVHGVPDEVLQKQKDKLKNSIKL